VTTFALAAKPNPNAELVEELGARYVSTKEMPIRQGSKTFGPFDVIFEATGASVVVFESIRSLGKDGVIVLSSITGGNRTLEVPADRINLDFVLGNKVMVGTVNANRDHYEAGVRDMAQAQTVYPGWLRHLMTHPVAGLENFKELFDTLSGAKGAIKVYCEVAA
jgi:threonine dehydrogenase-like Zn-dependent dehydrogenase